MRRTSRRWSPASSSSASAPTASVSPPDRLADSLRWLWPILLIGLGVALLVRPSRSRRENGAGDEVGAEGGEDGEIEEPGGGHDGGVGTFAERGSGHDHQARWW